MTTTPRRQNRRMPESRIERGMKLRRKQHPIGSTMIAIDIAMKQLNYRIDRSEQQCQSSGSGSIVGSVIQVPQSNPSHETHIDFLESVRKTLEDLVQEAP